MIIPVSNGALVVGVIVLLLFLPIYLVFKFLVSNVEREQRGRAERNTSDYLTAVSDLENARLAQKAIEFARTKALTAERKNAEDEDSPSESTRR